jgi:hypothetical protein
MRVGVLVTIVLALVCAGCGGETKEVVRTVTVEEPAPASAPPPEPEDTKKKRRSAPPEPAASEYAQCDANIQVKAETTTCEFAQNTFWHYWMSAESSALEVWSPAAAATLSVVCDASVTRLECTTDDGGVVRFPLDAVAVYSQAQADAYAANHDLGPDPYESLALSEARPAPEYDYEYDYDDDVPQSLYNPGGNIPNYENGRGYRVQCADGMYSHSGGIQGACSHHGGVAP